MSIAGNAGAGIWHSSVKKDEQTGLFIGHCLDLHVKVAGRSVEEAWSSLRRVLKAHYEYCYEFDVEGLRPEAPNSDWEAYSAAFKQALNQDPKSIRLETLVLHLRVPKAPDQVLPLSCQGVELAQAAHA
jgi:hypothetical protein